MGAIKMKEILKGRLFICGDVCSDFEYFGERKRGASYLVCFGDGFWIERDECSLLRSLHIH